MASVATDSTPGAGESIAKTNINASPNPSYNFSFTPFLRSNGIAALASTVPVCPDYAATGHCPRGRRCAARHPTPSQQPHHHHYGRQNDNYVCKHWLKGLCKKGDACDYLHEYNLRKMSECQFYNQNGYCQNGDECLYVHVKEGSKLPLCEDYNKGFCEKGPRCGKRHVRRKLCEFYMAGFCPDGPNCKFGVHLRSGGGPGGDNKDGEAHRRERERVADLERREDDVRKDFSWRGGDRGRGRGGRWRSKRDRRG
ncbi:RNA-binding component of cleavage and polyadenylation factor [Exophiala xenobiotica]|nr:RNA-binding component of cleavage and polyadenylation factor [Exophiala xenobiotica]